MIKKKLKGIVPTRMWSFLQKNNAKIKIYRYFHVQGRRFIDYSSNPWNLPDKEQIRGLIVYYIHRIEKGLSHSDDFRAGFGRSALTNLSNEMTLWCKNTYSANDITYQAALNVIDAYIKKHLDMGKQTPDFLLTLFPDFDMHEIGQTDLSGVKDIFAKDKVNNREKNFAKLFNDRSSVRSFASSEVDKSLLAEAVQIAMKTPSVCNRQSYRVTLIHNPAVIKSVLDVQGGWRGYQYPPELAIVSTDVRSFINVEERNEPYIDGGIFTMSLLLSLEYVGLAACPLNTMCDNVHEKQIRVLAKIPDYEVLIVCIAIGNFPEHTLSPKSFRYMAEDIMREID